MIFHPLFFQHKSRFFSLKSDKKVSIFFPFRSYKLLSNIINVFKLCYQLRNLVITIPVLDIFNYQVSSFCFSCM